MDAGTSATITEKDILWRVNFEEFVRRLRHQVYTTTVSSIRVFSFTFVIKMQGVEHKYISLSGCLHQIRSFRGYWNLL